MEKINQIDSSFRDPSGYMFEVNGELYRAVRYSYKLEYDYLISSGLYATLVNLGLLVSFEEIDPSQFDLYEMYKVIKPLKINFISYPYEWSINMLKDAALLTLKIQEISLKFGMSLKDASAFNIQFYKGKPIFIDSLSFEIYQVNHPWVAYKQFCQHFLAPIALMSRIDPSLNKMFIINLDGIPIELAVKMLPYNSRFSLGLFLHIYLHAKAQKKYSSNNKCLNLNRQYLSYKQLLSLVRGLKITIENLKWKPIGTEWADYEDNGFINNEYSEFKKCTISKLIDLANPKTIWDLGSNNGSYSRLASQKGIEVLSCDFDAACVKRNYTEIQNNKESHILPLFLNLLNPSPSIGWGCKERLSFFDRNKPDLILALALIHHLAISGNVPFESIALNFSKLSKYLIIEFIPKEDKKVQILLQNRDDIFQNYTQSLFENAFLQHYNILYTITSKCSQRIFYLMERNEI